MYLFSGSLCRQSSTKAWKWGLKVRLYGCGAAADGSPLVWRELLAPGPSQMPESAPEHEGFMVSSSGGMVLVSSRQGTVPFSFSSSICNMSKQESPAHSLINNRTEMCVGASQELGLS